MKTSLNHLPAEKRQEVEIIAMTIRQIVSETEMVILFGSYARGDWKDGLHTQGRGRLTIHKKSDYDILVITRSGHVASNITLWHDNKVFNSLFVSHLPNL